MRFKLGLVVGYAIGYWVGSTPADQRRTKVESVWTGVRDNPRVQRISETVTTDAHRVTDAVEQRLVNTADGATRILAGRGQTGEEQAASGSDKGKAQTGSPSNRTSG